VAAVDISPQLIEIAERRASARDRIRFVAGDMLDPDLGRFDFALAMDSLIYYGPQDIRRAVSKLSTAADRVVYTVAPRTPLLMAMWQAGKLFPRSDRSPIMVPHATTELASDTGSTKLGRVSRGFYISEALETRT
jgi:magnesium-protoporphyrin O-methyltransferase